MTKLIALSASFVAATLANGCGSKKPTPLQEIGVILSDVPAGSTAQQVSTYLSAKKIEHSELGQAGDPNMLQAIVRERRSVNIVQTNYEIRFRFQDQRLVEYDIKPKLTGP